MTEAKSRRGYFISFEGAEGAGKSTQAALLADALRALGHKTEVVIEPGITDVGKVVRTIVKDRANVALSDEAEALLLAAGRAQNVSEIYRPLLAQQTIIIADRYVDSSYAYQGYARGLGFEKIKELNDFAIDGLLPDLTLLLDLDYNVALERRHNTGKVDRFDLEANTFHEKVHNAYQDLADKFPKRIKRVDASGDIDTVHLAIMERVNELLGTSVTNKVMA